MKRFGCWVSLGCFLSLLFVASGCGKRAEIRTYQAPKIQLAADKKDHKGGKDRMLSAMVTLGETAWFFKVTGPEKTVAAQAKAFQQFIQSLKFSTGVRPEPSWTLPEGWKKDPAARSSIRFATLKITTSAQSGDQPLELTVIPLPVTMKDQQQYELANVNRWRQQLQLQPLAVEELKDQTKTIQLEGGEALMVNLVGQSGNDGMRPPFAGGGPFSGGGALPRGGKGVAPLADGAGAGRGDPSYTKPGNWSPGSGSSISVAAFEVRDGDRKVEITITPAGGSLLPNVNRWRGQVGLEPISFADLEQTKKQLSVDGAPADYVTMVGQTETIFGVVLQRGGTWFIKLRGDTSLAAIEKERFEFFVKSLKF